jgi:HK97 gp10 family phage protein
MSKPQKVTVRLRPQAVGEVRTMADAQLNEMVEEMTVLAAQIVPRDTGNLARSIANKKVNELHYQVHTEAGYGAYVELGTSRMQARPYLAPAFEQTAAEMKKKYPGVWK